jgi:hypothetical protein
VGRKSDARAEKKALARKKFEANKAKFVAKVNGSGQPRQAAAPPTNALPRVAPHLARRFAEQEKAPKAANDGSRFSSQVTWCITKADRKDRWSWGEPRDWQQDEWDSVIHPPLQQFAGLTWGEVDQFSSETGHKMHHGHEVSDLVDEAQERWKALDLEQYDSVFRFRLGGTRRVWGFIVQAHFHTVWWDRNHSIYPTEQS